MEFALHSGWGILNALVCVFLAYAPHHPGTEAKSRTLFFFIFEMHLSENPEKQKDIWFEPFFIRAAMSLVFNLFILVVS